MARQQYDRHYRKHRERKGRLAEWLAALFLQAKGYRILERRWKCRAGEIDLIASKNGILVFVEVKARATHEKATTAVTWRNRQRIEQAAGFYAAKRQLAPLPAFRFDIVTLAGLSLRHRRNAWRSGD